MKWVRKEKKEEKNQGPIETRRVSQSDKEKFACTISQCCQVAVLPTGNFSQMLRKAV
jgi:hypothetical protein